MKFIKFLFKCIFWAGLLALIIPLVTWLLFRAVYSEKIFTTEDLVQEFPVAIVFGAGLRWDGSPTPVLRDRVKTAVNLYQQGKVKKLLLSGDNRFENYNEPGAMQLYALELGVPEEDLVLDYAGRRTYDTCYRAKAIFRVDQAYLVTQNFHLPRALFLCSQFGVESFGINADIREYSNNSLRYWNIREALAMVAALWDVFVQKPLPVLGEELPIF